MSISRFQAEWLSLLDISGPFLSLPVLVRRFPQGLEADAVIVIDISDPASGKYFSVADFYVACSRAKHLFKLLPTTHAVFGS